MAKKKPLDVLEEIDSIINKELPRLFEYKNITDSEIIWLEIYGDQNRRKPVGVAPKEIVFLNDEDIIHYKRDPRFIEGHIVPVESELTDTDVTTVSNTMSDEQIKKIIEKTITIEEFVSKLEYVTSAITFNRVISLCKVMDKPYSWISSLEEIYKDIFKKGSTNG